MENIAGDELEKNERLARLTLETALKGDESELLASALRAGADVNLDLGDGCPPLHYATDMAIDGMIQNGRASPYPEALEMIRILIVKDADVHRRNRQGKTALDAINTYAGSEQTFLFLVAMFEDVIPSLSERVLYQPQKR